MSTQHAQYMLTIFSTGGKFWPVSSFTELHSLTPAAHPYALLIAKYEKISCRLGKSGSASQLDFSYWSELLPEDSDGLLHLRLKGLGYLQHVQQFRVIHLQQHAWGGRREKKGVGRCDERSGLVVLTQCQKLWVLFPAIDLMQYLA